MELRDSLVSENTSRQCFHRLPVVMTPGAGAPSPLLLGSRDSTCFSLSYNIMVEACCNVFYRFTVMEIIIVYYLLIHCFTT